jgi:hypothetical protein
MQMLKKRFFRYLLCAIVVIVIARCSPVALGGMPAPPVEWDVIVATVQSVSPGEATNAHPPELQLDVMEVLRGGLKARPMQAVLKPFPHYVDTGVVEENPRYKVWAKSPMKKPAVGEKLILFGDGRKDTFGISPSGCFPYSDEKRAWALKRIALEEKHRKQLADAEIRDKKKLDEAKAKWNAMPAGDIAKFVKEADLVVVGRVELRAIGVDYWLTLRVRQLLKGQLRGVQNDDRKVDFVLPGYCRELMQWNSGDYILFYSENGLRWTPNEALEYPLIRSGLGFLPASESHLKAAKSVMANDAPGQVKPIVVVQFAPHENHPLGEYGLYLNCCERIVAGLLDKGEGKCRIIIRDPKIIYKPDQLIANTPMRNAATGAQFSFYVELDNLQQLPADADVTIRRYNGELGDVIAREKWLIDENDEDRDRNMAKKLLDALTK